MSGSRPSMRIVVAVTSSTALLEVNKIPSIVRAIKGIQEFSHRTPLTVVSTEAYSEDVKVILDRHNLFATFIACNPNSPQDLAQGLKAEIEGNDALLIHDASRPLTRLDQFTRIIEAYDEGADAIRPATVFTETLKIIDGDLVVLETLDRTSVKRVATPELIRTTAIDLKGKSQGWFLPLKKKAHIVHIEGAPESLRINTKEDGLLMESFLHWRQTST
jgi:2-C-methyl-D-erythritol 4-phosphate cytidylyltransferase